MTSTETMEEILIKKGILPENAKIYAPILVEESYLNSEDLLGITEADFDAMKIKRSDRSKINPKRGKLLQFIRYFKI